MATVTGGAAARPVQRVGGFSFPAGPGPERRRFDSEALKWREISETLKSLRGLLSRSDRAFYRQLIAVEAMALQNLRDRGADSPSSLTEPELSWFDGGSGPSRS